MIITEGPALEWEKGLLPNQIAFVEDAERYLASRPQMTLSFDLMCADPDSHLRAYIAELKSGKATELWSSVPEYLQWCKEQEPHSSDEE